jgi:hypothetical protein
LDTLARETPRVCAMVAPEWNSLSLNRRRIEKVSGFISTSVVQFFAACATACVLIGVKGFLSDLA